MKNEKDNGFHSVSHLANQINITAEELNDIFVHIDFVRREKEWGTTHYILKTKGKQYGNQIEPDEEEGRNYYYVYYKNSILKDHQVLEILINYNDFLKIKNY
ncbi:MAG: putative RecB family nuclease [Clostridium sp.]|jgi:predicted RecB family nuclease